MNTENNKEGTLVAYLEPKVKKFIDRIIEVSWCSELSNEMALIDMAGYEQGVRELWKDIKKHGNFIAPNLLSYMDNYLRKENSSYLAVGSKNGYKDYKFEFAEHRGAKNLAEYIKSCLRDEEI